MEKNLSAAEQAIPQLQVSGFISAAVKIRDAIDSGELPKIGFCPLRDKRRNEDVVYDYVISGPGHNVSRGDPIRRRIWQEDLQEIKNFQQVYKQKGRVYQEGYLDTPFKLKITLPDYTFEDSIPIHVIDPEYGRPGSSGYDAGKRLSTWYRHGKPSGYGDLREHVTKFDRDVRSAREIAAENFQVEPVLLREVEKHWKNHFYPPNVRAEPYKIHMYGPGDKFDEHRDTPQTDLVGTFLVGLGDNTWSCHLVVDGSNESSATEGSWVAFYPDVPHKVKTIINEHHFSGKYRAVLALKIFRDDTQALSDDNLLSMDFELGAAAEQLLTNLEVPFGLVLDHKYCLGTTELSGVDAIIHSCAKKVPHILQPVIIPIVIRSRWLRGWYCPDRLNRKIKDERVEQTVTFVEALTNELIGVESDKPLERWNALKEIPFYDLRGEPENIVKHSSVVWSNHEEEINYVGNEADGERADSVYLSYAILCLDPDFEVQSLFNADSKAVVGNSRKRS
ncbi:hypothetical protein K435DRAFT_767511 [Dendrothele bispora CBS 962.96]|uniref:Fe2OG dioxygenase domain-containing protein n=1 Tax=Dendrothele bispora (strain CBS 962.96) TaxID=1314807 RepID=A0A4S8KYX6_DENBC|nr:hypothetical protein K435DRAFT_767511 [Dendrothele bispora CBS 962.96]